MFNNAFTYTGDNLCYVGRVRFHRYCICEHKRTIPYCAISDHLLKVVWHSWVKMAYNCDHDYSTASFHNWTKPCCMGTNSVLFRWGEVYCSQCTVCIGFSVVVSAPFRHHRLKYGNLKITQKPAAATTDAPFKGKRRLAELRSMYKEAVQTDSECFGRHYSI